MDSSPKYVIYGDELLPLIKERLEAGHLVQHLPFRGISMLPMLRQEKDSVELSPLPEQLKPYDLPMYQRKDGKMVIHRIVAVKEDYYVCMGDNTEQFEKVFQEQMIGIVSAFWRGDKRIEVTSPLYRLYCRLWRPTRPLRILYKRAKRLLRKMKSIWKAK